MKKLELYKRVLTALCQWLVGLVFAFSGIVKCIDPVGAQIKLTEYLLYFGMDWLADWTWIIAWVQALVEFSFGLCVCFGRYRRSVLPLTMLFMCFMTPLTLWLALTDPIEDCGCFGDAIILTNWQTFTKNVVLLAASIWLMFNRRHMLNVLSANFFVLYYYGLLMGCVLLLACGTFRLPFIDFRPYRPGVDLRAATQGGVGKKVSEYVCVYEKEGERREFSLDDLPDEAEGWVFVDAYEVMPIGGSDVQEHDDLPFFALKTDGTDFTSELLADTGYTFLLLSPALSEASEHDLDRIENIYEYARQEGYAFYGLTLADTTQLLHWVYRTGAEYEMLFSDQTVIQTMIRCNPGLMLLHDGIILWKTHLAELDMMTLLSVRLSEQSYGQMQSINQKKRVFWIILWLIVPLCLYLPLQIVKHRFNKKDKKMRKKIVAGNWKMNTTLQEGVALAEGLKEALAGKKVNCDVVVCTPFISVASVVKAVEGSVIGVGAEDCSAHDKGAYTGEVAANMVASTGAKYVILGHSERRQYHGENNEILVAKLQQALANGLTPIFCVGEVKEERENGTFKAVIEGQMEAMYTLSAEDFAKCVVAYEPVWAIGTGLTATSEQAQEVHAFIRASIAKKYNAEVADNTSILYGGSCKGSNAPELFAQPDIDGGLIGGAALKVDTFMPIIEAWK